MDLLDKLQILKSTKKPGLTFSQSGQDSFIGDIICGKSTGYFVDVGARDGKINSNTYYLEKSLGWRGILVEPHPDLYKLCLEQRLSPSLNCACSNVNEELAFVKFLEEPYGNSGLLQTFPRPGRLNRIRHEIIHVQSRRLTSILDDVNAPTKIDYLDVDVEGHEVQVLESLDLEKYSFRVISAECKVNSDKFLAIAKLLSPFGFTPIFRLGSDVLFMKD